MRTVPTQQCYNGSELATADSGSMVRKLLMERHWVHIMRAKRCLLIFATVIAASLMTSSAVIVLSLSWSDVSNAPFSCIVEVAAKRCVPAVLSTDHTLETSLHLTRTSKAFGGLLVMPSHPTLCRTKTCHRLQSIMVRMYHLTTIRYSNSSGAVQNLSSRVVGE